VVGLALALLAPLSSLGAQDIVPTPTAQHPTEPGAPFFPSATRANVVEARAELLIALDQISAAEEMLVNRVAVSRTQQILESQRASYERELAEMQPQLDLLAEETEVFGIEVGAFPVDELRKMFWDDWGQPRSGGRAHAGNDMLAQVGVPLRAIEDSVYEQTINSGSAGLAIYLVGDSGTRYLFAHMDSALEFDEGQRVYAAQVIGTNGDTGNARGAPHLHLQMAPDGESGWENPFPLMDVLWGGGSASLASSGPTDYFG